MGSVTCDLSARILNYVRRRQASFVRCNTQIGNDRSYAKEDRERKNYVRLNPKL